MNYRGSCHGNAQRLLVRVSAALWLEQVSRQTTKSLEKVACRARDGGA